MRTPALLVSAMAVFALAHRVGVAQGSDTPATATQKIAQADQERERETNRLLITALFDVAQALDATPTSTPLLDEWRQSGTVQGVALDKKPAAQTPLPTTPTARIIGLYGYPLKTNLLTPAAYLSSGEFDKAFVVATPGRPLEWYRGLLAGAPDHSILMAFHNVLSAPDFDGARQLIDAFRLKIWAIAPTWNYVSNVHVWHTPVPKGLDVPNVTVDSNYGLALRHIWSMTNFINYNWPEIPIVILVCENRYTNGPFVQAMGFTPSAYIWKVEAKYQWGSGQMTPSRYASSHFNLSGREALARYAPSVPVLLFGQTARLRRSPPVIAERRDKTEQALRGRAFRKPPALTKADAALESEAQEIFSYAAQCGYAGACLYIK